MENLDRIPSILLSNYVFNPAIIKINNSNQIEDSSIVQTNTLELKVVD